MPKTSYPQIVMLESIKQPGDLRQLSDDQLGELVAAELPKVARLLDRFQHDDLRI